MAEAEGPRGRVLIIAGSDSGGGAGKAPEAVWRETGELGFRDPLGWGGGDLAFAGIRMATLSQGLVLNLSDVGIFFATEDSPVQEAPARGSIAAMRPLSITMSTSVR